MIHLINEARSFISAKWKDFSPPTVGQWLTTANELMKIEYMTMSLKPLSADRTPYAPSGLRSYTRMMPAAVL